MSHSLRQSPKNSLRIISVLLAGIAAVGCNGTEMIAGETLGYHDVDIEKANLPFVDDEMTGDPNHLTIAVKYVNYVGDDGAPVLTAEESKALTKGMNELVKVCNMHFRLEEYVPVRPQDLGLDMAPASMGDLEAVRTAFDSDRHLVVTNTGSWTLPANAWTAMPGSTPSGAVVEAPVASDANLVAHELGHYLNLDHASDPANLMNPTIYSTSTYLSDGQCAEMRQAALTVRAGALRS